jgi:hypothetical protein
VEYSSGGSGVAKETRAMAIRMELSRILVCEMHDLQVIELTEVGGDRTFPILIGISEAEAIRRRFQGVELKRPLTHELLVGVIEGLGGTLESITVSDLSDHTFYATLDIRDASGELRRIDSRPSDAVALAAGTDRPIWVEEHVIESAQADM